MDSITDLLAGRKPIEPPEIGIIKGYVHEHFNQAVGVTVRERDILVTVRSSALAGSLRMHSHAIGQLLPEPVRRLVFRVGTA